MGGVTATTIKPSAAGAVTYTQTAVFDELGRLLRSIGANTQTTTFAYDKTDNLKSVADPRSGLYSYGYDALNRLISETDQVPATVALTRDGKDDVTAYADPRSLVTSYVRNGFGEVIQQGSPDSGLTVHTRDARGLVTKTTDGRGVVTTYTYDAASSIKTRAIAAATTENKSYTYDAVAGGNFGKGRLTSLVHDGGSIAMTYDVRRVEDAPSARCNVIKEIRKIGTVSYTVQYTYDVVSKTRLRRDADRVTQITYPSGRQVQYVRDAQGQITAVNSRKISTAPRTASMPTKGGRSPPFLPAAM